MKLIAELNWAGRVQNRFVEINREGLYSTLDDNELIKKVVDQVQVFEKSLVLAL